MRVNKQNEVIICDDFAFIIYQYKSLKKVKIKIDKDDLEKIDFKKSYVRPQGKRVNLIFYNCSEQKSLVKTIFGYNCYQIKFKNKNHLDLTKDNIIVKAPLKESTCFWDLSDSGTSYALICSLAEKAKSIDELAKKVAYLKGCSIVEAISKIKLLKRENRLGYFEPVGYDEYVFRVVNF